MIKDAEIATPELCSDIAVISYDKLTYWDSISSVTGLFGCIDIILNGMTLVYLDTVIFYYLKDTFDLSTPMITLICAS